MCLLLVVNVEIEGVRKRMDELYGIERPDPKPLCTEMKDIISEDAVGYCFCCVGCIVGVICCAFNC